jgi:hypothetical protein
MINPTRRSAHEQPASDRQPWVAIDLAGLPRGGTTLSRPRVGTGAE